MVGFCVRVDELDVVADDPVERGAVDSQRPVCIYGRSKRKTRNNPRL